MKILFSLIIVYCCTIYGFSQEIEGKWKLNKVQNFQNYDKERYNNLYRSIKKSSPQENNIKVEALVRATFLTTPEALIRKTYHLQLKKSEIPNIYNCTFTSNCVDHSGQTSVNNGRINETKDWYGRAIGCEQPDGKSLPNFHQYAVFGSFIVETSETTLKLKSMKNGLIYSYIKQD